MTWCSIEVTPTWLAKWDIPIGDMGRVLDSSARGLGFDKLVFTLLTKLYIIGYIFPTNPPLNRLFAQLTVHT